MNPRPRAITIIGWLFVVMGVVSLVHGLMPNAKATAATGSHWYVHVIHALTIVGGVYTLCGRNWGRWLLAAWMVLHIGISAMHSVEQVVMHTVIFSVIGYFLFRRQATAYFQPRAGS